MKKHNAPWAVGMKQATTEIGGFTMIMPAQGRACVAYVCTTQDANLIAAAPDLLDVCQAIVTAFEGNHFPTHVQKHVLDGAKAAIAKAEGR